MAIPPPAQLPPPLPPPSIVPTFNLMAQRTIIGIALILEDNSSVGFKLDKPVIVRRGNTPVVRIEIHGSKAFLTLED